MLTYPVDVPAGAISEMTRILRGGTRRVETRAYSLAIWNVKGYLMRVTIGVPVAGADADGNALQPDLEQVTVSPVANGQGTSGAVDVRSVPPITEESRSHFAELYGLLKGAKPVANRADLAGLLVDDEEDSIFHMLDLWLADFLPLSPPPAAAPVVELPPVTNGPAREALLDVTARLKGNGGEQEPAKEAA